MKKRSCAFRPASVDLLEGRVVLSTMVIAPSTAVIHEVGQTRLNNGQTLTTDTTITHPGAGVTVTAKVTHEANGSTRTVNETATTSGGTTNFTKTIALPTGATQTETGTNVARGSTSTITPGGIVVAHPDGNVIKSMSTTFTHVINQPGLGTETITGTTVSQYGRGETIKVTDQTVVEFDGTTDKVHVVTVGHGTTSTTRTSTIAPDGTATTMVRTAHRLSMTRS